MRPLCCARLTTDLVFSITHVTAVTYRYEINVDPLENYVTMCLITACAVDDDATAVIEVARVIGGAAIRAVNHTEKM